jgi:PAS domain-containing protein
MSTTESPLWIDTDSEGRILQCSPAALELIGYTKRSAPRRLLPILFLDRRPTLTTLLHALLGRPVEREGTIRPRGEQRAVHVRYRIALAPESTRSRPVLRWTFQRQGEV